MDRTTLRGIAFWSTVFTSVMVVLTHAIQILLQFLTLAMDSYVVYRILGVVSLFFSAVSMGSLMLFLGMVHYDLSTAQRLAEHARDYLNRDLTQSSEAGNPPKS